MEKKFKFELGETVKRTDFPDTGFIREIRFSDNEIHYSVEFRSHVMWVSEDNLEKQEEYLKEG
ncbi:MAG: hypothetical protein ACOC1O_01375 [bacterium]